MPLRPSVCLFVHTNSAPSERTIVKSDFWRFFEKSVEKTQVELRSYINGPFTWRPMRVYAVWLNTSVYVPPPHIHTNLFLTDGNMWEKMKASIRIRKFLLCVPSVCPCRISFLLHLSTSLLPHTPSSDGTVVYLINSFLGNDRYKRVSFVTVFCSESSVSAKCRLFTDVMLLRS